MQLLRPSDKRERLIRSLGDYSGRRYAFNVGGEWKYFPAYVSVQDYETTLATLVSGAAGMLELQGGGEQIIISTDPFGAKWREWLLPMWNWEASDPIASAWDPEVRRYAELFKSGTLPYDYSGICISDDELLTLRFCADLVLRNLAPFSWIFSNPTTDVSVYFHNTSSFGLCTNRPLGELRALENAASLGLEIDIIQR